MKKYLIVRQSDSLVQGTAMRDDPDAGPTIPDDTRILGCEFVPFDGEFTRTGRRDTESAYWRGGAVEWVETETTEQALSSVIVGIDAAADAARLEAIGDPARALEYQQAEAQAREYRSRLYGGEVPPDVESWAKPKGWTSKQAADDIITTAENWRAALSSIRKLRLAAKEAARFVASDPGGRAAAIRSVRDQFLFDLRAVMAEVQ
jgi:hypothetical protein